MNLFEASLLKEVKKIIEEKKVKAVAYRLKQAKFCSQVCDLLVDSPVKEYYLAIECKSRKGTDLLNFNHDFSTSKEGGQLEVLKSFCDQSGRLGLVVFKSNKLVKAARLEAVLELKEKGQKSTKIKEEEIWKDLGYYLC